MKRYQLCGEKSAMVLSQEGHWVTLEDFEEMKTKLETELKSVISVTTGRLNSLREQIEELNVAIGTQFEEEK